MGKTKYQPSKKARLESRYKKNVNPKKADRLNEGDKARRRKSLKSVIKKAGSMLGRAASPKANISIASSLEFLFKYSESNCL